jgi:hypothetical protein
VADFVALAALAKQLIDANGRTVTIIKNGTTPQDTEQPWRGLADYQMASVTGIAAFVPSAQLKTWEVTTEDNTKRGTNYVLFPASYDGGHLLEFFDELLDGDTRWKITSVEVLGPAATRLLYMIKVNR